MGSGGVGGGVLVLIKNCVKANEDSQDSERNKQKYLPLPHAELQASERQTEPEPHAVRVAAVPRADPAKRGPRIFSRPHEFERPPGRHRHQWQELAVRLGGQISLLSQMRGALIDCVSDHPPASEPNGACERAHVLQQPRHPNS